MIRPVTFQFSHYPTVVAMLFFLQYSNIIMIDTLILRHHSIQNRPTTSLSFTVAAVLAIAVVDVVVVVIVIVVW